MKVLEKTFGKEKRWVTWKLQTVGGKTTKVPYTSMGLKASSTDSDSWVTYEEIRKKGNQIGIVFLGQSFNHFLCLFG